MILIILVLFCTSRVDSETQTMQYRMHVSRKSRSNSPPTETGYVYSQVNNNPGAFASFSDDPSRYNYFASVEPYVSKHSDTTITTGDTYNIKHSDLSTERVSSPERKYSDIQREHSDRLANYNDFPGQSTNNEPAIPIHSEIEKYGDKLSLSINYPLTQHNDPSQFPLPLKYTSNLEPVIARTAPSFSQYSVNHASAKARSKQGSNIFPSLLRSGAVYERLKSLMHYRPSPDQRSQFDYDTIHGFYRDNDDVRTSSRTTYNNWPYFLHSPYEYEHNKIDSGIQKAKDKRFAIDTSHRVIPVHEQGNDDANVYNTFLQSTEYPYEASTSDNPIAGHQPFFSFVLNDYFDKSGNNNDPLTFKGLEWGKEFDDDSSYSDNDYDSEDVDYGKRNRRLQGSNYLPVITTRSYDNFKESNGESATEKGYSKTYNFDNYEKGSDKKSSHELGYNTDGKNIGGFKDFVDTFINKFGSEDYKKDSKYTLKHGQDKGEKRKGFRRVYHKDEYQEDNEFFDNTNHSAKGDEKGSSSIHSGGSGAHLQSHAAAALGNETNAYRDTGNTSDKNFENNHTGHDDRKGFERDFNRYRDVAKQAVQSNNADYTDHYRI